MTLKRPTTKEKEEKGETILLCGNKLLIPNSKKSKCDFCGVLVYYNTEERYDMKICPKCFLKRPIDNDEFRLTKEAKKVIEDRLKPKFTAI